MVSPKCTNDLEIEYEIFNQHPYFEIPESCCKQRRIQSFVGLLGPVLGPITYYLSRERNFISRKFCRVRPQKSSKYPPRERQTFGEIRVFIRDVAIALRTLPGVK